MKSILLFLLLFISSNCFSQTTNHKIEGSLLDTEGIPISNVHIQLRGTTIGTASNEEGKFNLIIPTNYCGRELSFSHISYETAIQIVECSKKKYSISLTERVIFLEAVEASALSAEEIMRNCISNLEENFQLESVNYTMFSRLTEKVEGEPILLEEFLFHLYHEENSKPDFNVIKVRGKGFTPLGKKHFEEERLIPIHRTGVHIMLHYLSNFLKERKTKKYKYEIIDEIEIEGEDFYVLTATSLRDSFLEAELHISKEDFGIAYLKKNYIDEEDKNWIKTNNMRQNYFLRNKGKWYFTHGKRSNTKYYKKENKKVDEVQLTVAIDRQPTRAFSKDEEMGLMVKMLSDYVSGFEDGFWEEYNYIPLETSFKEALEKQKQP